MAKKKSKRSTGSKKPNKSRAIREYYEAHPQAKPREVVSALKKQGIEVNAQFVSTIRSVSKKKAGKKASARVRSEPLVSATIPEVSGDVTFDSLLKVKAIVDELGGVQEARKALDALEHLRA